MKFRIGMLVGINGIDPSEPKNLYRISDTGNGSLVIVNALTKQGKVVSSKVATPIPVCPAMLGSDGAPVIHKDGTIGRIDVNGEGDNAVYLFIRRGSKVTDSEDIVEPEAVSDFFLYADYINVIEGDDSIHEVVNFYTHGNPNPTEAVPEPLEDPLDDLDDEDDEDDEDIFDDEDPFDDATDIFEEEDEDDLVLELTETTVQNRRVFLNGANVPSIALGSLNNAASMVLTFPTSRKPFMELIPHTDTVGEVTLRDFIREPERFSGLFKPDANGLYNFMVTGYIPADCMRTDEAYEKLYNVQVTASDVNVDCLGEVCIFVDTYEHHVDDDDWAEPILEAHLVVNYNVTPINTGGVHVQVGN